MDTVCLLTPRGSLIAARVRTRDQRANGLRPYSAPFPMLFLFARAAAHPFTMKGVGFDLDLVFLRAGRVVDVLRAAAGSLGPLRGRGRYDAVLELPAGDAAWCGLLVGAVVRTC